MTIELLTFRLATAAKWLDQSYPNGEAQEFIATINDAIASTRPADSADRCPYCDDTGDVHDATGEWRGECKHGPADSALAESLEAAVARADDTPGMRISILRCAISDAIKALRQPAPRADDALREADDLKGYCDRPQGCVCAVDHFRSGCAHWHKTVMGHDPARAALAASEGEQT